MHLPRAKTRRECRDMRSDAHCTLQADFFAIYISIIIVGPSTEARRPKDRRGLIICQISELIMSMGRLL